MTTISLEEALKRATKGPLVLNKKDPTWVDGPNGEMLFSACDPSLPYDEVVTNAALLAHCYNQLHDLVSRLEALQKWAEQMGGFNSPQWADLPELIERANKVQLP